MSAAAALSATLFGIIVCSAAAAHIAVGAMFAVFGL